MRVSREQLNKLKQRLGVDTLWSFSRYNSYLTDPYGYYLNYVEHIQPEETDGVYTFLGGRLHDIMEGLYEGNIEQEDMIDLWENAMMDCDCNGYKFPGDKDKSELVRVNYNDSISHFCLNYKKLPYKVLSEKFIVVDTGKHYFQGYIDAISKDKETGEITIIDWKSSSIYKGEKRDKESAQLLLYSLGVSQKFGVPLDKIKACWCFAKYCTVVCDLKTIDKKTKKPKTKSKICQRNKWISESSANIKSWLCVEYGFEKDSLELATAYQDIQNKNSLENYPLVEAHFRIEDCYDYIEVTEEAVNNLIEKINKTLDEINYKIKKTRELDDRREIDKLWWTEIDKGNEFYFKNLLGYNRQQHKPLDMYLKETEELFKVTKEQDDNFDW